VRVAGLVALLLVLCSCGGRSQAATCTRVRGGAEATISFWSCASEADAHALRGSEGFASCRRVEGMDADSKPTDLAYKCRRVESAP
jgi:hypothetical protein